jgi:hypothetical protein
MLGIFGRIKPLSVLEDIQQEYKPSEFRKIQYILELEGFICSLDPEFNKNGILRKAVNRLRTQYNALIYTEICNCANKQYAKLKKDGSPFMHKAYIKDWAL